MILRRIIYSSDITAMASPLPYFRRLAAFAIFVLSLATAPVSATAPEGANRLPTPCGDIDSDEKSKGRQKSSRAFDGGFRAAHSLIEQGDYEAGIAALRALRRDMHPDVANDLGYASHKLGNYDDAKFWYEEALTADPRHTRAWSHYGIWHAEQGNVLKARDYLDKVCAIGGADCPEYRELAEAIEKNGLS
jgi:tetratricopeptide (TPR) repeat protein